MKNSNSHRIDHIITNAQIAELLTIEEAIQVMRKAFPGFSQQGSNQERVRIDCGSTKLSMMGAIVPGLDAVGAKVYTTINGKFTFAIVLFSATDGALLAVMEGEAMTEYRTAAVTALAADAMARKNAATLAIFGTGVQARAHVPALMAVSDFSEILVSGIAQPEQFAHELSIRYQRPCRAVSADEAAASADVLITATRASTPLFDGNLLKPGTFVAAIGSSKPDSREIDDTVIRRAARIVVESIPQAKKEAGDLILCNPAYLDWNKLSELADVLTPATPVRQNDEQIILYKAIGIGMEDVALAEFVYRQLKQKVKTDA
ncbi:ornithine cyclodeaminase family protein [Undibacterium sp. Ji49W]|uniref:ornithine cyclodeaminase family protein n=1 Tax=Undibacterium sp. Ji49W TaxID=3413040 RepID=UPI003BF24BC9